MRPLRLSTQLRIAGLGFKACSRPLRSKRHGKRSRRLLIMKLYGLLPVGLWLSVALGVVLPPQVIGRVVDRLRDHFIPRDPITPPDEVFPYPGMRDFQEWSLYQGWMRQYLTYLKWYCSVALAPDVSIDAFIDAPIYIRTWHSPKVDLSTFRFGVMFRVYDWVTELLMEDIRVLPISEDVSNVSILGSGLINREQPCN